MKLRDAIQVYQGLAELANKDIPSRFGFRVGQMLQKLEPLSVLHDREVAKLRHRYGLDQPTAMLQGLVKVDGAVVLRDVDQGRFQEEYSALMDGDAGVDIGQIEFAEIAALKGVDGKPLPNLGTTAAKLAPILRDC